MTSIHRNLVLWGALALAIGMAVAMAATYAVAYGQINSVYDEEMVRIAEAVHLGEDWRGPSRVRIPRQGFNLSVRAYSRQGEEFFSTVEPAMPADLPKLFDGGYTILQAADGRWRVYTHVTPEGVVQVGQPEATRSSLARLLSLRMALPELVLIPFFVIFMGWVLRRSLAPLHEASRRVQERDATRLDALPTANVPAELRPLIEQINALLTRLASSMAAQRRFVADAAHELRTPIAALALQVQVAERAAVPATRAAAYAELRSGIARATRVVEQLLRLAQLDPDAPRDSFEMLDLAEIAREVVGSMAYRARSAGIDLGAEAEGPARMAGSRTELRSLISNLVDNALRYAPPDSEVTVRVRSDAGETSLSVLDAGPGIPRAERERVFERFRRAAGDETPGIGLGLAIAKAVAERHGGTIALEDADAQRTPPGLAACVRFPPPPRR